MALAFSPEEDYVVSGDALGNLRVWALNEFAEVHESLRFQQGIRWLGFSDTTNELLVQTEEWLHNLAIDNELRVLQSHLLPGGLVAGAAGTGRRYLAVARRITATPCKRCHR